MLAIRNIYPRIHELMGKNVLFVFLRDLFAVTDYFLCLVFIIVCKICVLFTLKCLLLITILIA